MYSITNDTFIGLIFEFYLWRCVITSYTTFKIPKRHISSSSSLLLTATHVTFTEPRRIIRAASQVFNAVRTWRNLSLRRCIDLYLSKVTCTRVCMCVDNPRFAWSSRFRKPSWCDRQNRAEKVKHNESPYFRSKKKTFRLNANRINTVVFDNAG